MSEPTRWGPPGPGRTARYPVPPPPTARDATVEDPTVQLPMAPHRAAPYPAAPPPTARYPVPPQPPHPTAHYPAPPQPTRQEPAPYPPPTRHDDGYGDDGYRDDGYRDDGYGDEQYRDERYDDGRRDDRHREEYRRPRRRGQVFAGLVLVLAVMAAALLGMLTYQTLASIDLISEDPLGSVAGWTALLGVVALGALGVFVLALIAFVIARPKALAGLALTASVLLPVGAGAVGLWYGGDVLRQNVQNDFADDAAGAADAFVEELQRNVPDIGPLRDLIVWATGQGG